MENYQQSRLEVDVTDTNGQPINQEVVVLLNENSPQFGNAYRLESKNGGKVSGDVAPGPYTLQAFAKDYQAAREFIEVHRDRNEKTAVRLKKSSARPTVPVKERLQKRYGIKVSGDLENLTVDEGQTVALNYRQNSSSAHMQVLRPKSLKDLKAWVGSPDDASVANYPRFGALPKIQETTGEQGRLALDQQSVFNAIAREYIYGNSRAVPVNDTKAVESRFLQVSNVFVPVFYFLNIEILNGATLEIGKGSSSFVCDTLTIHPKGTLRIIGDIRVDVGKLVQL